MSDTHEPTSKWSDAGRYEIRLQGHLDGRWSAWFDGLTLTHDGDGTTVIHATLADQCALHGLLRKVNDIGVPLVAVTLAAPDVLPANRTTNPR
jgi:hypothetical protein